MYISWIHYFTFFIFTILYSIKNDNTFKDVCYNYEIGGNYFMSKSSAAKKSIIVGGLIGTGGLFVSKLIGLAYTIPFSYILQSEAYQSVYAQSYNIYAYLLTIFQSGVPFAVATLVARYMALEDAKSVILVNGKLFTHIIFSYIPCSCIIGFSWVLPRLKGNGRICIFSSF